MYRLLKALRQENDIANSYTAGQYHHMLAGNGFEPNKLAQRLVEQGHSDVEIKSITPDIEDIFIKLLSNEQH